MDIINQRVSYNSKTNTYSYTPWYLAKGLFGGKMVSERILGKVGAPSYLVTAYSRCDMNAFVMYPKPLHLVVRYGRIFYWRFLRVFYWMGLVDTSIGEAFSWRDFYRIKSH